MKYSRLVVLVIIVIGSLFLVDYTKVEAKTPYYDLQIEAANKVNEAYGILKAKRDELNIPIDLSVDPLETGVIGTYSPTVGSSITTTLGSLSAKQTSTNPNFVALIMDYFQKLEIKANESVAVNFSSSFPALNIMTLIALDTLEIDYLVMSSIGSSTYGANIVEFTYLKMEEELYLKGLIKNKTEVMSLGGVNDVLEDIEFNDEGFSDSLYNEYSHIQQIKETDFYQNVMYRFNYYNDNLRNIKAFVNVGGNISGMGQKISNYENGLLRPKSYKIDSKSGLIERFLNSGVSVINLLNINDLALKNGLERFAGKAFIIGVGDAYYTYKYQTEIAIVSILVVAMIILFDYQDRTRKKIIKENTIKR